MRRIGHHACQLVAHLWACLGFCCLESGMLVPLLSVSQPIGFRSVWKLAVCWIAGSSADDGTAVANGTIMRRSLSGEEGLQLRLDASLAAAIKAAMPLAKVTCSLVWAMHGL